MVLGPVVSSLDIRQRANRFYFCLLWYLDSGPPPEHQNHELRDPFRRQVVVYLLGARHHMRQVFYRGFLPQCRHLAIFFLFLRLVARYLWLQLGQYLFPTLL